MATPQTPTIKSLFPELSETEVRDAEQNVDAYLALVIRVYKRISQDPKALGELRKALYSDVENPLTNSQ